MTKTKTIPVQEGLQNDVVENQKKESIQLIGYKMDFLESLLQYLNTKPHGEVRGFIDGLQQGQPVEV